MRLSAEGKGTLQETIELRKQYAEAPEPTEDGTAQRISTVTGLSEQQVHTYQPFLVPIAVSFLAGVLITIGLEAEASPGRQQPAPRLPEAIAETIDIQPEPKAAEVLVPIAPTPRMAVRPRPKLAAITRQPIGAVLDFLHSGIEIIAGPRTEMADAYIGYADWCKAGSLRPLEVAEFVDGMEKLCKRFGIRITAESDRQYLHDVRLATDKEKSHA